MPVIHSPLSQSSYRQVLGRFATGVTAVTAYGDQPIGLTVNSFTSVSLDPPLVSFCVNNASRSWPAVRAAGRLCVNILGQDQRNICAQFAASAGERFQDVDWTPAPDGSPILTGAIAWLNGSIYAEHAAGDHVIVVVHVERLAEQADKPPLVLFRGQFAEFRT
ncbi:MAG: flavin reductase family protein [Kibdelosporangium sp.]